MQWRSAVALRLIELARVPRDRDLLALDIGCGAGQFREQIERATSWRVDVTDLNPSALRLAKQGRGRTLYYDVTQRVPAMLGSYDTVFLFDVIEHVEDARGLLASALEHLRPGGHLLINVPALGVLFSAYDAAQGHLRRYTRQMLAAQLEGLPCQLIAAQYWGLSLVPLLGLRRILLGRRPTPNTMRSGFRPPSGSVNRALKALMGLELRLVRRPLLGTSVMAAVRRLAVQSPVS
jgi:SAM-dependent methyltransferase